TNTNLPTSSETNTATNLPATSTATVGAATESPTQPVGVEPNISLAYDDTQLVVINITNHSINVSSLNFVQHGKADLRFDSSLCRQVGVSITPDALPSQFCFQVYRNDRIQPETLKHCRRATWAKVADSRWFWIASDPSVTSFDVLSNDRVIASC